MLLKKLASIGFLAISFYPTAHSAAGGDRRDPPLYRDPTDHHQNTFGSQPVRPAALSSPFWGVRVPFPLNPPLVSQARHGEPVRVLRPPARRPAHLAASSAAAAADDNERVIQRPAPPPVINQPQLDELAQALAGTKALIIRNKCFREWCEKYGIDLEPFTRVQVSNALQMHLLDTLKTLGLQVQGILHEEPRAAATTMGPRFSDVPVVNSPPSRARITANDFQRLCDRIRESGEQPLPFALQEIFSAITTFVAHNDDLSTTTCHPRPDQIATIFMTFGIQPEGFEHLRDAVAPRVSKIPAAVSAFTQPPIQVGKFTTRAWISFDTQEYLEGLERSVDHCGSDALQSSGQGAAEWVKVCQDFAPLPLFNGFVSLSNVDEDVLRGLDPNLARFLRCIKGNSCAQAVQVLLYLVLWGNPQQLPSWLPVVLSCDDPHNQAPVAPVEQWIVANTETFLQLAERVVDRIVHPHARDNDLLRDLSPLQQDLFHGFFAHNTPTLLRTRATEARDVVAEEGAGIYPLRICELATGILERRPDVIIKHGIEQELKAAQEARSANAQATIQDPDIQGILEALATRPQLAEVRKAELFRKRVAAGHRRNNFVYM